MLDLAPEIQPLAEPPPGPANSHPAQTRCVLLAAGGEHPPERLMKLLDQPSTQMVSVAHPLLAAAELALLERTRHETLSSAEQIEDDRTVLIVANRESWKDLSPLFRMVRLQMPTVSIWVCTDSVAIEVHSGREENPPQESEPTDPPPQSPPPPRSKPTRNPTKSPLEGSDNGDPADVSDEELRRLLELFDGDTEEHGE